MSRSLLVLPDDSAKPILDAIRTATKSISVKMFVFSDPALLEAVVAARRRGVKVRVMLNPARRSGEEDNEDTRQKLTRAGIDVVDGNPAFDLTHKNRSLWINRPHSTLPSPRSPKISPTPPTCPS